MKNAFEKLKKCFTLYFDLHIAGSAAELSYYFLFSVFPLIMAMSAITVMLDNSENILPTLLEGLLPTSVSDILIEFYAHVRGFDNSPFLYSGILLAFYAVARYITVIKRKIREIFEAEKQYGVIKEWALSFLIAVFIVLGFYLTFILQLVGERTVNWLSEWLILIPKGIADRLLLLRFFAIGIYVFLLLLAAYRFIPNRALSFRNVLPGTLFSGIAWIAVSVGFSFYADRIASYTVLYGSISGFIVLMLWLFLVNSIILLGALINRVLCENRQTKN